MSRDNRMEIPVEMYAFVTTEHFTLSSARGVINGEISSRISIYFTTLSSVLIAAAFIAQLESMQSLSILFGWTAFPLIVLLGLFTLGRVMILSVMDRTYIKAINRVRHFYSKAAPGLEEFLLFPPHDDETSIAIYGGYATDFRGNLLSMSNMVIFANSLAATLGIGALFNTYFDMPIEQFLPVGVVVLVITIVMHSVIGFMIMRSDMRHEYLEERFPMHGTQTNGNSESNADSN